MEYLVQHGSYVLITVVLILTGSGLPVPEEVPIIAAAILSASPSPANPATTILNPWLAFACCLFGAVVGDSIMYWIGYHFGRGVLRDHPWWARWVTPEREAQIEEKFRQHGFKVFFVARFLVVLRSPVYLTAGILRLSFKRFLLIDLFCATVVVGTFFGLTYLFGQYISRLIHEGQVALTVMVVIALVCLAFYLWRRYRRKIAALGGPPLENTPPAADPAIVEKGKDAEAKAAEGTRPAEEGPAEECPADRTPTNKSRRKVRCRK
jgi:membrane protein DedA with SNARE-associated domain